MIGGVSLTTLDARAEEFTPISQDQMSVVEVDSVEETGEGTNGPGELVLDDNNDTYWHTQWQPTKAELPHHITIKLGEEAVNLARVRLLPRQSSNGSGRVNEYELWTASGDCETADFTMQAEGSFPGEVATAAQEREIVLDTPVDATCAKVVYVSSWGGDAGDDISPSEKVATLAEFNADTVADDDGTTDPPASEIVVPEGAVELVDGDLKVRVHPDFPQVVDYRLGDEQMAGSLGDPLTTVLINEVEQDVEVAAPVQDGQKATYALTFPGRRRTTTAGSARSSPKTTPSTAPRLVRYVDVARSSGRGLRRRGHGQRHWPRRGPLRHGEDHR